MHKTTWLDYEEWYVYFTIHPWRCILICLEVIVKPSMSVVTSTRYCEPLFKKGNTELALDDGKSWRKLSTYVETFVYWIRLGTNIFPFFFLKCSRHIVSIENCIMINLGLYKLYLFANPYCTLNIFLINLFSHWKRLN